MELWRFKFKESLHFVLHKNISSNKNETESKMENLTRSFREANLVLQLIKSANEKRNYDKLELAKGKREHFSYSLFCPREVFLTFVLSQYIVYWNFENIHTFTYQKRLLHTLFCLFFKSWKTFSVFLTLREITCQYTVITRRCCPFFVSRHGWLKC